MLPLSSPPALAKQRSPSFRNKRIPSVNEHYHPNPLKPRNEQSPSKSEEIRRRKSQHLDSQLNNSNGKKKCKLNATRDLMTSIQDLKEEYKTLREAYKQLIQEKLKYAEEISNVRQDNSRLKVEIEECRNNETAFKSTIDQLTQQLQAERKARAQLETDLYFFKEKQMGENSLPLKEQDLNSKLTQKDAPESEIEGIDCRSFASSSNILSFSLTSVLEESIAQQKTGRKREHAKVVSNLSNFHGEFENIELKPKKENMCCNFKKNKKESIKLQLVAESKESKALSVINPLSQLLSLKSPVSGEKKSFKNLNSSSSKRRREDKQNLEPPKGCKKKSKKILQINSPQ